MLCLKRNDFNQRLILSLETASSSWRHKFNAYLPRATFVDRWVGLILYFLYNSNIFLIILCLVYTFIRLKDFVMAYNFKAHPHLRLVFYVTLRN